MSYFFFPRGGFIARLFIAVLPFYCTVSEAQNDANDNPEVDAIWQAMQDYTQTSSQAEQIWYLVNMNDGHVCRETPSGLSPLEVTESIPGILILDSSQDSLPGGATVARIQVELDGELGVFEFANMHGSCLILAEQNNLASETSARTTTPSSEDDIDNECTVITTGFIAGEAAFGFSPIRALDTLLSADTPDEANDILTALPFTWNSRTVFPYCNGIEYVENVRIATLSVNEGMLQSHGNTLRNYYYGVAEFQLSNGTIGSCTVFAPKATSSQCID